METKNKEKDIVKEKEDGGFIQYLKEKKAKDGKLNKLGEWFLSGKSTGLYYEKKDLKYILR